ncbi:hypothetical protein [Hyphobacterium marinum]|uniref:Uncharacterized protein n=1 Tax=Hyphobacterium marinum TaxID=3116574 RepID=A0ABU7M0R2_9PROT|nr:hypothetical protein [Hyphobacterium sp. Y6023]MEE2567381.1 hypothetical protein [Hyphobacterium sp. Y6023]
MRLPIAALACLVAAPAVAQDDTSPLDPLYACRAIEDSTQRLACLDRTVDELRAEEEAGGFIAVRRDVIEAADEASYGLSIPNFNLPRLPRMRMPSLSGSESSDMASAAMEETSDEGHTVLRNEQGQIERISGLAVASLSEGRRGRVTVRLENGQVWNQIDDQHVRLASARNRDDNTVEIRNAALGSHMMRLNGTGRWFRVSRSR